MLDARSLYFQTLGRIVGGLASHSDARSAETFARLREMFALLDLRTAAGEEPTIDSTQSGLPILREVISLAHDVSRDVRFAGNSPAEIRAAMLDDMLARRQVPSDAAIAEMARALYHEALSRAQAGMSLTGGEAKSPGVFLPDPARSLAIDLFPNRNMDTIRATWDVWDGARSRAVRIVADFRLESTRGTMLMRREPLIEVAKLYSGASYTLLSLASEIDERVEPEFRLKRITKVTVGPFLSPIFSKIQDPLTEAVSSVRSNDDAWALRWTIDTLSSVETRQIPTGFLQFFTRPQEVFQVNRLDPDCVERGAGAVERHVAMPPEVFQRIHDDGTRARMPSRIHYHILAQDGRLIENA